MTTHITTPLETQAKPLDHKTALLTVALAGNPNAGKTTAFNEYTGARQRVGNYPGITVEKKEGLAMNRGHPVRLIDLPGTYSLTAYSQEEVVARRTLVEEHVDIVIDIVNSSAIERNLYLTVQFLELGIPVAVGLNMIDEAKKQGIAIDNERLSSLLGIPVVETIARTGQGLDTLLEAACKHGEERRGTAHKPLEISYGPDLDPVIGRMTKRISEEGFLAARYPARWIALKYLENDEAIRTEGKAAGILHEELLRETETVSHHLSVTLNSYPEAIIADYRYGFISGILKQGAVSRKDDIADRIAASDRADRVLTHRFFGPIIMLGVLYAIYSITFTLGEYPTGWMESVFGWLNATVSGLLPDSLFKSLIVSGIIDGVGGVFGFVPLILIMFFLIAALEDSGYMARIAYMLDKVFRIFGLHGYSVMPYIVAGGIAGGCAVPAVMATRTLRSPREKLATILTLPFLTCGAKLPVFLLIVGIFFPENAAKVMFLLTVAGWITALLVARLLRSTLITGPATPFVMELPPYRLPTLRGLLIHTWERIWQYIKKAGTIILAISILLWAAMTFPGLPDARIAEFDQKKAAIEESTTFTDAAAKAQALAELDAEQSGEALRASVAGRLGIAMEGISRYAGFDWRTNIALVGGFAAKEVIVSTLGTAYSLGAVNEEEPTQLADHIRNDPNWTPAMAAGLLLFVLLYAPCFVTVVMIRRETGSWKWALFGTVFNTAIAFTIAVAIFQIGTALS